MSGKIQVIRCRDCNGLMPMGRTHDCGYSIQDIFVGRVRELFNGIRTKVFKYHEFALVKVVEFGTKNTLYHICQDGEVGAIHCNLITAREAFERVRNLYSIDKHDS